MRISIDEMSDAINKVCAHLKEQGIDSVEIESDYYWYIPDKSLYDSTDTPIEFTIGQLQEDVEHMLKIAHGESQPIGYALVWCATILRYIGNKHIA